MSRRMAPGAQLKATGMERANINMEARYNQNLRRMYYPCSRALRNRIYIWIDISTLYQQVIEVEKTSEEKGCKKVSFEMGGGTILYFIFYILHFIFYILYFIFYILYFIFYILYFTFYILYFIFCILYFLIHWIVCQLQIWAGYEARLAELYCN